MDLENLSDDELNKMVAQKMLSSNQAPDYSQMSDDDLNRAVAEKMMQNAPASPRTGQAALEGFGQAATLGYLPNIQAAVEKGIDFITPESEGDKKLKELGIEVPEQSYAEMRDANIKRQDELQEESPLAYNVGQAAGAISSGIATSALGGAALAGKAGQAAKVAGMGTKAATAAGRTAQAGATGASLGFLKNPSDTEGEISPLQIEERLKNASIDAVTGVVLQGGLESLGKAAKVIKNSPKNLKRWSELKALKASGAMLKDYRKAMGRGKAQEMGRTVLDNGIVSAGDDVAMIAKKAEIAKSSIGKKIGKIYEESDAFIENLDPSNLTVGQQRALKRSEINLDNFAKVYSYEMKKRLSGLSGKSTIVNRIEKELGEISQNGVVDLKKLREVRASIDDQINFSKGTQELGGIQKELVNLRNKLQNVAKERVRVIDKINGTNNARDLIKSNKDFSNLSDITKMARDKASREEANAAFGMRERLGSGVGAMIGGSMAGPAGAAAGAVVAPIAIKTARQFGTPVVARMANKASKILLKNQSALGKFAKPLEEAAKKGGREFVVAVELYKNDPDFLRLIENKKGGLNNILKEGEK